MLLRMPYGRSALATGHAGDTGLETLRIVVQIQEMSANLQEAIYQQILFRGINRIILCIFGSV